jgi:hypothetical protein
MGQGLASTSSFTCQSPLYAHSSVTYTIPDWIATATLNTTKRTMKMKAHVLTKRPWLCTKLHVGSPLNIVILVLKTIQPLNLSPSSRLCPRWSSQDTRRWSLLLRPAYGRGGGDGPRCLTRFSGQHVGWAIRRSSPDRGHRFFSFPKSTDMPWGSPSLLYNGYRHFFPGIKGPDVDYPTSNHRRG